MILENCKNRHTNLSIAWIDYKNAFDNVPHSWIEKCLETSKYHGSYATFFLTAFVCGKQHYF